jgi:predicted ATP-grasp superfamily ATP-dependent carboligase
MAGLDDARGVYAARTLARHQVPIIGISKDPACFACHTNACEQILFAETTNEELIRALETLGPTLSQKALLLPCHDMSALLISRHRRNLEKWYHINLPEPGVVEMLFDKVAFYRYAKKNNFPIPKTYFLERESDVESVIAELTFPCILKPSSSKTPLWLSRTHIKAIKILDVEQLRTAVEQYSSYTDTLIVQDWIEGGDDTLYMCFFYSSAEAQPLVTFVCRKLRQWLPQTGDTCLAEECANDFVLGETLRLLRAVKFCGLGFIEFKRDARSEKTLIVEPNFRVAACMGLAEAGGVELLYTMYCDTIGSPLLTKQQQRHSGQKWVYLRKDIMSAIYYWLRGDLTIKQWWGSLRGRKVDALLSWGDLGPFWYDVLHALYMALSKHERKRRLDSIGLFAVIWAASMRLFS